MQEKIVVILTKLQQQKSNRPRMVRTLGSTINALFQKSLSEDDIRMLVDELIQQKIMMVEDNKVSYTV